MGEHEAWIAQRNSAALYSASLGPSHVKKELQMGSPAAVVSLSTTDKIAEAMNRSLPLLPTEARRTVEVLLQPQNLAIIGATLAVWIGSHFFGVGEVVDVILLSVGVVTLGFAVFDGAAELYDFARFSVNATTDRDLDLAAQHFSRAVTILGISTIQANLLRGQARTVVARGRPTIYPRVRVGTPPPAGNQLRLTRPATIAGGSLGETSAYGAIRVARNQSITEQRLTLLHELVHRYFSPRTGPLRQLRAELNMAGYTRSMFLRYLEEALAEGYAQLRVNGLASAVEALRFPIQGGYVTVSQLVAEGAAIGTIFLGGTLFHVSISLGELPDDQ